MLLLEALLSVSVSACYVYSIGSVKTLKLCLDQSLKLHSQDNILLLDWYTRCPTHPRVMDMTPQKSIYSQHSMKGLLGGLSWERI